MLNLAGAIFSVVSLILLTGAAFKDEKGLTAFVEKVTNPVERRLIRLLGSHYEEVFVKKSVLYSIHIALMSIMFSALFLYMLSDVRREIVMLASSGPGGLLSALLLITIATPMLSFVTLAAFIFPLAAALRWARSGGSEARFVARLGVLCGVLGIVCQTFAAYQ